MDESESILKAFTSTTNQHMDINVQQLSDFIHGAELVVMADAFVSSRSIEFAKCFDRRIKFINNTCQPHPLTCYSFESVAEKQGQQYEAFVAHALDAVKAGKNIVIVWGSQQKGLEFEAELKHRGVSYLYYHKDAQLETLKSIRDVQTAWSQVQVLMYTSVITVGVNFDPEEAHFDRAYIYGSVKGASPRDSMQSLLRVRKLRENAVYYCLNDHGHESEPAMRLPMNVQLLDQMYKTRADVVRSHLKACGGYDDWFCDFPNGLTNELESTNERILHKMHVYNDFEDACKAQAYKEVFTRYLINECGYKAGTELTGTRREKLEEVVNVEFMAVPDITELEAKEMMRKPMRGGDENAALDKYFLRKRLSITPESMVSDKLFRDVMDEIANTDDVFESMNTAGVWTELWAALDEAEAWKKTWDTYRSIHGRSQFGHVHDEVTMRMDEVVSKVAARSEHVQFINAEYAHKYKVIKDLTSIMGLQHSQDTETTVQPAAMRRAVEYVTLQFDDLAALFLIKPRVVAEHKANHVARYTGLLKSIFNNWSGCHLKPSNKGRDIDTKEWRLHGHDFARFIVAHSEAAQRRKPRVDTTLYDVFDV
jgi:hypothetical protein